MKFEFPSPPGSGAGSPDFASVEDWRGMQGDSSDTGTLQAAVAAAKAAGGMQLLVPAQSYALEEELLIDASHIYLIGEGAGWHRSTQSVTQNSPRSKFLWAGDAGGTIVRFNSPGGAERRLGGGMRRIQLDGNAFSAARGLHLESWLKGDFEDLTVFACSESQFRLSTVDYVLVGSAPADTQNNTFSRCMATTVGGSGTYLTSTAYGWHLTGSTATNIGNTSFNTFYYCHARMAKGIGWKVENTDNNHFISVNGGAIYDSSVYGMELGSSDQDSILGTYNARYNLISGCQMSIHARASQTGGGSSGNNVVYGYSRANGTPLPTIEAGAGGASDATLNVYDNQGLMAAASLALREGIAIPNIFLNSSHLFVGEAAGPLKLKDSTGAIREFVETSVFTAGEWTPIFSFTTPGDSVITHTVQNGRYLRLGSFVLIMFDLQFNTNAYTTAAGAARISGLPYSASFMDGALTSGIYSNLTFNAAATDLTFHVPIGASIIQVRASTSDALSTGQGVTVFPASKTGIVLKAFGMYWTANPALE